MLGLLAAGCRTPDVPLPEEAILSEKKGGDQPVTRSIRSAGGSLDGFSDDGKRTKVWSMSWGSATLEYTTDQQFGGVMQDVKGTLFQNGVEASTFMAAEARADKGTSILRLLGGVVVTAVRKVEGVGPGTLRCGEMTYDGVKGVIDAKGGIQVKDGNFFVRGTQHVMANAKLTQFATPDMFEATP